MVLGAAADLFEKFTADSNIEQIFLYSLLGQMIGAAAGPFFRELTYGVNIDFPTILLSPPDLASSVVRGFLAEGDAAKVAQRQGYGGDEFKTMVQLAGQSLAPEALASALRRGIIPRDSGNPDVPGFIQGVQQGNLRDMWTPVVEALALGTPTPTDAIAAYVKGQIDEQTATSYYEIFGGDPKYFTMEFDTAGQGPSPDEAALAARRGIIPWTGIGPDVTSFSQAVHESAYRDKWEDVFKALAQYFPPPRTVSAMFKAGALTLDQAKAALTADGVPDDIQDAYLPGQTTDPASDTKKLALSTITEMYTDQLISKDDATSAIESLGYAAADAALILAIQDVRLEMSQLSTLVGRVRSLYLAYKISDTEAINALNGLNLPGNQVPGIIALWQIARQEQTANLTQAEITDAWSIGVLSQADAMSQLESLGYTPQDAWVLLSIKNKGALPDNPGGSVVAIPNKPSS